jgi:hypothetical protein
MNRAPLAPIRLNPNLPPKLEDIINRALEKDRELRYQHAVDIKSELRRLKRDLESGHNSAASSSSEPPTVEAPRRWKARLPRPTERADRRAWLPQPPHSCSHSPRGLDRGHCGEGS